MLDGDFAFVVVDGDNYMAAETIRGKTLILWIR
jgi:hypothetical protein